jgi:hypothetical protein
VLNLESSIVRFSFRFPLGIESDRGKDRTGFTLRGIPGIVIGMGGNVHVGVTIVVANGNSETIVSDTCTWE